MSAAAALTTTFTARRGAVTAHARLEQSEKAGRQ